MAQLANNPARAEQRLSWGVGLLVWIVLGLHLVPGGGVNPNRYVDLTHSLVNQHSLNIDAYHENTIDKLLYQGHYYIAAYPGPSFLALPSYLVFEGLYRVVPPRWLAPLQGIKSFKADATTGFYAQQDTVEFFLSTLWITWWTLALLSALAAVFLIRLLRLLEFPLALSVAGAVLYAFGTNVFFFSTSYFSQCLTAAFVIFCLYFCARALHPERSARMFVWIGGLAGTSLLMEYAGAMVLGLAAIYVLYIGRRRGLALYSLGAVVPCLLLAGYNTAIWGIPWGAGYQYLANSNVALATTGFFGFVVPSVDDLWKMLFSVQRGLFVFSPVLLLAPIGWTLALRAERRFRPFYLLLIALAAANFIYNLSFSAWFVVPSFGLRYLIPSLACWAIGVIYSWRRVPALFSIPLFALSLLQNWLGAQYGYTESIFDTWHQFVTNGPTLPMIAAILDHSPAGNSLRTSVLAYRPFIMLGYTVIVGGLILALYRQIRVSPRPARPVELPA